MSRDDFPSPVKKDLAARTGYRCSRPACDAPTSGPASDVAAGATNIGVAAHITAASAGGPRYDGALTQEERRGASNGIWLCQNCASLIDRDETRFTGGLLRSWRTTAEALARRRQGLGGAFSDRKLSPHSQRLGPEQIKDRVAEFLTDVGATGRWQGHFNAARIFLTEIALNCFQHGSAIEIELASDGKRIFVRDAGRPYGIAELRLAGRGGHHALQALEVDTGGELHPRYKREDGQNVWWIAETALEDGLNGPCSFVLKPRPWADTKQLLAPLAACQEVHCYVNYSSSTISEVLPIFEALMPKVTDATPARILVHGIPSPYLRTLLARDYPQITFVD